jgi:hypothetical protein
LQISFIERRLQMAEKLAKRRAQDKAAAAATAAAAAAAMAVIKRQQMDLAAFDVDALTAEIEALGGGSSPSTAGAAATSSSKKSKKQRKQAAKQHQKEQKDTQQDDPIDSNATLADKQCAPDGHNSKLIKQGQGCFVADGLSIHLSDVKSEELPAEQTSTAAAAAPAGSISAVNLQQQVNRLQQATQQLQRDMLQPERQAAPHQVAEAPEDEAPPAEVQQQQQESQQQRRERLRQQALQDVRQWLQLEQEGQVQGRPGVRYVTADQAIGWWLFAGARDTSETDAEADDTALAHSSAHSSGTSEVGLAYDASLAAARLLVQLQQLSPTQQQTQQMQPRQQVQLTAQKKRWWQTTPLL